jgi:VTC domain
MLSPEATQDVAARPAPGAGERELKFTLPSGRAHLARRRLESLCRRDPEFPSAIVWTVYYDTPALASLGEKLNSDYLKRKIRVRWYSDLAGRVTGPAFVEAKMRLGTHRSKVRARVPYPADEIARWDLQDPRLLGLPLLLREHGILGQGSWQPMMLIRYRRDRFIEPLTQSRVSLDTDIVASAVNPRFQSVTDRSPLATAVLEVKGRCDELPPALRPLLSLGMHKRSFSKFLVVYAHMTRSLL